MCKYKTIFFDLDDTLIDNNESLKYAFSSLLNSIGLKFNNELFEEWKRFDTNWWNSLETGNLIIPTEFKTKEEQVTWLRASRFIAFFKDLNISFNNAIEMNKIYTDNLAGNIVEVVGAEELLAYLYNINLKKYTFCMREQKKWATSRKCVN